MQAYLCVCVCFFCFPFFFFLPIFFLLTKIKTKVSVSVEILQPNFVLFLREADSATVSLDYATFLFWYFASSGRAKSCLQIFAEFAIYVSVFARQSKIATTNNF